MRIRVCIATCNRNDGLCRALLGLAGLEVPADIAAGLSVLVVDNNAGGEARAAVDAMRPGFPWPLDYVHETRRGISHARNTALEGARGADFLAFMDDDEVPEPGWLARLVEVQRRHDVDVVTGPTLPVFPRPAPKWLVEGGFLASRRWPDATPVDTAFTGNVLVRMAAVSRTGARFAPKLALVGGEDIHFFDQLRQGGSRILWADGAVMYEFFPPDRTKLAFLVKRWFRIGNSEAIVYLDRNPGAGSRALVLWRGGVRVVLGLGLLGGVLAVAGLGQPRRVVARLYTPVRGMGMLVGLLGLQYRQYADSGESGH